MGKKLLALVLSVLMLVSLLPVSALAAAPLESPVIAAPLEDRTTGDKKKTTLNTYYAVSQSDENITIGFDNLEYHMNGDGNYGYWNGVAVEWVDNYKYVWNGKTYVAAETATAPEIALTSAEKWYNGATPYVSFYYNGVPASPSSIEVLNALGNHVKTFNVSYDPDHSTLKSYTLTATENEAAGGVIKVDGVEYTTGINVHEGDVLAVTAEAAAGFKLTSFTVDGNEEGTSGSYSVNVGAADVALAATWTRQSYNVHPSPAGKLSADMGTALYGATVTLTYTPGAGAHLTGITFADVFGDPLSVDYTITSDTTATFEMPACDVKVNATFSDDEYSVLSAVAEPVEAGSVTAVPETSAIGTYIELIPAANDGYEFASFEVTGVSGTDYSSTVNGANKFPVPSEDVNVTAHFNLKSYAVTTSAGENGTVTVDSLTSTTKEYKSNVAVTVTPADGYAIGTVTYKIGDDAEVNLPAPYEFTMPANTVLIAATFTALGGNVVTVTPPTNGELAASPATAATGETITVNITPKAGYELESFTTTPNCVLTVDTAAQKQFAMPAGGVTVAATFKAIAQTINLVEGANGTTTGLPATAETDSTVNFKVTPNTANGYSIKSVKLTYNISSDVEVELTGDAEGNYSFVVPAAACTITTEFTAYVAEDGNHVQYTKEQINNGTYFATALETGKITLLANTPLDSELTIPAGKTLNLDLNGKTLTAYAGERAFYVKGILNISDTSTGGKIVGSNVTAKDGAIIDVVGTEGGANGEMTMSGGALVGGMTTGKGGAVYVGQGATFTMSGGTIGGAGADKNTAGEGGAVYVAGSFTMSGDAYITGNDATNGGGVYVHSSSTFTMDGGTITANTATGNGGGVYIDDNGGAVLNTGTITANEATGNGGGVYNGKNLSMPSTGTGVEITANTAANGGGIYIASTAVTTTIAKGTVTGNTATTGAGVYIDDDTVWITENPTIDEIYIKGANTFNASALANTAPIEIEMETAGTFTSGLNAANQAAVDAKFTSADPAYVVRWTGESTKNAKLATKFVVGTSGDANVTVTVENLTTGAAAAASVDASEGDEIQVAVVVTAGYHLASLTDGAVDISQTTMKFQPTVACTVTAASAGNTYKVNYYKNGDDAIGSVAVSSATYPAEVTLADNGFTREGRTFLGWDENKDASTATYQPTDSFPKTPAVDGEEYAVYAIWDTNTYTVRFNGNGNDPGTSMADQTFSFTESKALTSLGFTKAGYDFDGWATTNGGPKVYGNGETVSGLSATAGDVVNLYAIWVALPQRVEIYYNGATNKTGLDNPYVVYYDTDSWIDLTAAPFDAEKTSFGLAGWIKNNVTGTVYKNKIKVPADGMMLDAVWDTNNLYTVTVAPGGGTGDAYPVNVKNGSTLNAPPADTFGAPAGMHFYNWKVTAGGSGTYNAGATITVLSDMTLEAQWATDPTVNVTNDHGTVTVDPIPQVIGNNVKITVVPDAGYNLLSFTAIPASGPALTVTQSGNDYNFSMPESNVQVTVLYEAIEYDVICEGTTNGTLTADKTKATIGQNVTATIKPDTGYKVKTATVNGVSILDDLNIMAESTYTITMDAANVTFAATFEQVGYAINVNDPAPSNGTVSADRTDANYGVNVTLSNTPAPGYKLTAYSVKGVTSGNAVEVNNGVFSMPAEAVNVTATFEKDSYEVELKVLPDNTAGTLEITNPTTGSPYEFEQEIKLSVAPLGTYALSSVEAVYGTSPDVVTITNDKFNMPAGKVTVTATFVPGKAAIGNDYYVDLDAAFTAAQAGDTITLLDDATGNYEITKNVTFDLNDFNLTAADAAKPVIEINGGSFTLEGTGELKPAAANTGTAVTVPASGIFNMYGGKISGFDTGVDVDTAGTFAVHGAPQVTGNTVNVNLQGTALINVNAALTTGASIGVKMNTTNHDGQFTTGFATNNASDQPDAFFTSDDNLTVFKMSNSEAALTVDAVKIITIAAGEDTHISSDKNAQAKNNPVVITLNQTPDANTFLKGLKITTVVASTEVDLTDNVNLVWTLAADGTFKSATFTMPDYDVTVTPEWKTVTAETTSLDKAGEYDYYNGDKFEYRGVFIPGTESGKVLVNYTVQEAVLVSEKSPSNNHILTIFNDVGRYLGGFNRGTDKYASTIVFNGEIYKWDEASTAKGCKWYSGAKNLAVEIDKIADTLTDGNGFELVIDGVPVEFKINVKEDAVLQGARLNGRVPAFIVTPATAPTAAELTAALENTEFAGKYTVVDGSVYNVDVYVNNQKIENVTLDKDSKIILPFAAATAGEKYFVGYYHGGAYDVLGDVVVTSDGAVPFENSKFTPYFLGIPAPHNVYTVAVDAKGTFTPATTAADYGDAVNFSVTAKNGYHLSALKYYKTADPTVSTDIPFTAGQTDFTIAAMPEYDITIEATFEGNTYTVSFVAGDNSNVSPTSKEVIYGAEYGELPEPTGPLQFLGWLNDAGAYVIATDTVTTADNHKLTAAYQGNLWTVDYDINLPLGTSITGGTAVASQAIVGGSSKAAPSMTYTVARDTDGREYTFECWTVSPDGTGAKYEAGDAVAPTDNMTLYAKWTHKVYLSYDANDGGASASAVPSTQEAKSGEEVPVLAGTMDWTDHTFLGWNTQADGLGANYNAGSSYKLDEDAVLYARWKLNSEDQTVIIYDTDGGTPISTVVHDCATYGTQYYLPNTDSTRLENYHLTGWQQKDYATDADVGTPLAPNAEIALNPGTTIKFKAVWEENAKASITFVKLPVDATGDVPGDTSAYVGTTYYPPDNVILTRADSNNGHTHYEHKGWVIDDYYIESDAATVYDGAHGYAITSDAAVTFYPHWKVTTDEQFTISFSANGGTWEPGKGGDLVQFANDVIQLPTGADITLDGMDLAGWNVGQDFVQVNTDYQVTGTVNMVAQWVSKDQEAVITTQQANIPVGTYGVYYETKLSAERYQGSLTIPVEKYFYLTNGENNTHANNPIPLPNGLSLSTDGVISGVPTKAGKFTFYIAMENADHRVITRDAQDQEITYTFTIEIKPLAVEVDLGAINQYYHIYGDTEDGDVYLLSNLAFSAKGADMNAYRNASDTANPADLGHDTTVKAELDGTTNIKFTFGGAYSTVSDTLAFTITREHGTARTGSSGNEPVNPDNYKVSVTLPTSDNYVFSVADSWANAADKDSKYFYAVKQKEVNATWDDPTLGYVYAAQPLEPTPVYGTYIFPNDIVESDVYYICGDTTYTVAKDAATYTAVLTLVGEESGNYVLVSGNTKGFTISPRPLDDFAVIKSGFVAKTYNEYEQEPDVQWTLNIANADPYVLADDTGITLTYSTTAAGALSPNDKPLGAATYDVTVTGYGNYTGAVTGYDFIINQALNTITYQYIKQQNIYGEPLEYTATAQHGVPEAKFFAYNPDVTDVATIVAGAPVIPKNVGQYYLVFQVPATTNYALAQSTNALTFYINPKPLVVGWNDPASYTYSSSHITPTPVVASGVVSGDDTPTLGVAYYIDKDTGAEFTTAPIFAGTYIAVAEIASNTNDPNNNYTLDAATMTYEFTIDPMPITITASNTYSKTYGDADPDYSSVACTVDPYLCGTDTLNITLVRNDAGENVGTYDVTYSTYQIMRDAADATASYDVTFVPGLLTINPKPITYTWDDAGGAYTILHDVTNWQWKYTYGDQITPLPVFDGILPGDVADITTVSNVYLNNSDTLITERPLNVGIYQAKATVTGAKAGNYDVATTPVLSISIDARNITLSTTAAVHKTYLDPDPDPIAAVSIVNPAPYGADPVYTVTRDAGEAVNTYDIKVTYENTGVNLNYNITPASGDKIGDFVIDPRPITGAVIDLDAYSADYSGNDETPNVTVTLTIGGNDYVLQADTEYTLKWTNSNGDEAYCINADTYTVTAYGTGNYTGSQIGTQTFTVNKVNATCAAPTAKTGLVYTGAAQELIIAGTATGGEMQYNVDGGAYSTAIPTGTAAKTYTVGYKVVGDANHYDVAEDTISVTISSNGSTDPGTNPGGGGLPSGGGSTGGGSSNYFINLVDSDKGTLVFTDFAHRVQLEVSAKAEISLTATPDQYYVIDKVTYTKKGSNEVFELKANADGTYTVKMADIKADITVTAKFVAANKNDPSVGKLTIGSYTKGYLTCDGTNCPMNKFVDLKTNAWYHDGIHYCLENGIMQGFGNEYFKPDEYTTRAQVVTVLWNIAGHPIAESPISFVDVKEDDWFYEAIMWAAANGIVEGYGNGYFGPNDLITHEQIAKILYGYAKFYGYDVSAKADISQMEGAKNVSNWAYQYVEWAVGAGVCCGQGGNNSIVAAIENCTRAELATMMLNFCIKVPEKQDAEAANK